MIGSYAFAGCVKLTDVYCYARTVPLPGAEPFNNSNISSATLYVPAASIETYAISVPWRNFGTKKPFITPSKSTTTFSCSQDVDFSGIDGLKAYIVNGYDSSIHTVFLKEITNLKAGEGAVLMASAGNTYYLKLNTANDNGTNYLVGVSADTEIGPIDGNNTNFVLSDGKFYRVGEGTATEERTLAKGKAYLRLPTEATAGASSINISTEKDITGIVNVEFTESDNSPIYDLGGRKVEGKATKGIYLKNGKKVIVK